MIIVMRTGASTDEIDDVRKAVAEEGLETYVMVGEERIVMGVVGVGVERVQHVGHIPSHVINVVAGLRGIRLPVTTKVKRDTPEVALKEGKDAVPHSEV